MHKYFMTRRKVRLLSAEDRFGREGLALDADFSLTSRRVIRMLDEIANDRGYPDRLGVDNGPENVAAAMLQWSVDHNVRKPAQNAWIESFNARVQDEFLNAQAFWTLPDLREEAAAWLTDYNEVRPRSSLNYVTPKEFVESLITQLIPQLPAAQEMGSNPTGVLTL